MKRKKVIGGRGHVELNSQAAGELRNAVAFPERGGVNESRQPQKMIEHCSGGFTSGDHSNISDRLSAPAQRSHNIGLKKLRRGAQMLQYSFPLFQPAM